MNFDFIEIYYCPYCLKLDKALIGAHLLESPSYPCQVPCTFCGEDFKVIDCLERCKACERQLSCLGEPKPIVATVATVIIKNRDDADEEFLDASLVLREINRIVKKYGSCCMKEDFVTSQRAIYGNR